MQTAICIASGPSLTQSDIDYCRGKGRVYAVNDSWRMAPWADVLYAADGSWWDHHKGCPDFAGERWTVNSEAARQWGLQYIDGKPLVTWSDDPTFIATGGNSGFQAVNLAVHHGADRIILLGYDMGRAADGKKHWFGDHDAAIDKTSNYDEWIKRFSKAAPLIRATVINASAVSALECFPKIPLREAL